MLTEWEVTKDVVNQFDKVLTTKAQRMDVLEVDNKFRNFVKLVDFEKFK